MTFSPSAYKGTVHIYSPKLIAFEFANASATPSDNILIMVGGLGDGLLTSPFFTALADRLPSTWSYAQAVLSSSYTGWTTSSIRTDATEISACVAYFRTVKRGKIAVIGHSTGCQDLMEYLTGPGHGARAPLDAAILQAPVSDREGMVLFLPPGMYDATVAEAQAMVAAGRGEELLASAEAAKIFGAPVCARRWLSLASPGHDGEEDYFSGDLTDGQLGESFGRLPPRTQVCVLVMGSDEFMRPALDKEALVARWVAVADGGGASIDHVNSGVVTGGTHDLSGVADEVLDDYVNRVGKFLVGLHP